MRRAKQIVKEGTDQNDVSCLGKFTMKTSSFHPTANNCVHIKVLKALIYFQCILSALIRKAIIKS